MNESEILVEIVALRECINRRALIEGARSDDPVLVAAAEALLEREEQLDRLIAAQGRAEAA